MSLSTFYGSSTVVITLLLFAAILISNEAGYRYAKRFGVRHMDDGLKSQTNAIQGGMLGLLALLLGLSFSMGLQRYDARSAAVVAEANAIGTAAFRAELLPEDEIAEALLQLRAYVAVREYAASVTLDDQAGYQAAVDETRRAQAELWRFVRRTTATNPAPVTASLFVQAVNGAFDAFEFRQAALQRHIPEVVIALLFVVFIVAGSVLGYASGLGGRRPWLATVSMSGLIALVIFIVIDLDRPRRGLITVDQSAMMALALQMDAVSRSTTRD